MLSWRLADFFTFVSVDPCLKNTRISFVHFDNRIKIIFITLTMTVITAYFEQKWLALEHLTKIVCTCKHACKLQNTPTTPNIQLIFGLE